MTVTITIKNKRTGEVRIVTPDEALSLGMPIEKVVAKVEAAEKLQQFSEGKSLIATEGEKEAGRKEESAATLLDDLFALYYGKEGEQPLSLTKEGQYRLPAQLRVLGTKIKAGKANSVEKRIYEYNRILESKRSKLAKAAGDAGNLDLQEQILAGKGLPGGDTTFGESLTLFQSAYDNFAGGARPKKLNQLIEQTQLQRPDDQPTGAVSPSSIPPTQPPEERQGIGKYLTPKNIGLGAATAASFVPPVGPLAFLKGAGLVGRGALAGGILGATQGEDQEIGERLKGATTGALGGGLLGGALRPGKLIGGIIRSKTSKEAIVPVKSAIQAGKEYIKDVPMAKGALEKILPSLQKSKNLTIPQAEKKLISWWEIARTKSGDVKSTAQAQLYNNLFQGLRGELAKKAPLVSAARTASNVTRKVQKATKGLGKIAVGGAATGGGFYLLNRLLGRE